MTTVLHIDSSARAGYSGVNPFGSHTRRLTHRLVENLRNKHGDLNVIYRDVGQNPPSPVSGAWIHSAFTPPAQREPWMHEALAQSDVLVDELLMADIIVAGIPMYNFGPPAQFKAYIDNIVRVGRTFGFDRSRPGEPYWPMLSEMKKHLVVISARGDYGYEAGGKLAGHNHVENSVRSPFHYLGISTFSGIAVEYDEFADDRLADSIMRAERAVDELATRLLKAP